VLVRACTRARVCVRDRDASLSKGVTLSLRLQEIWHGIWLVDLTRQFSVRPWVWASPLCM